MNVAIYYRYSSGKDAQKANSERRQKSELESEALNKGWRIVWSDGDKETSGDVRKPKLEELKKKVTSKELAIDIVYVSSWDRLTRKNSLDCSDDIRWIRDAGAKIAIKEKGSEAIDLTDNQRLMFLQMEVYAANQYLKDLSNKVRSGIESRIKRQEFGFSNAPFGFDLDHKNKSLTPNEDIKLVAEMFDLFVQTRRVVPCLEIIRKSKTKDYCKNQATTSTIKTILRNPIYIGFRAYGVAGIGKHGQIRGEKTASSYNVNRPERAAHYIDVRESIKPVVSKKVFNEAQTILDENKKHPPKRSPSGKYKYSSLITCTNCGSRMVAEQKVTHVNYVCPRSKIRLGGCDGGRKTVHEDEITDNLSVLTEKIMNDEYFHLTTFTAVYKFLKSRADILSSTNKGEELAELEQKEARVGELIRMFTDKGIGDTKTISALQEDIDQDRERLTNESKNFGDKLAEILDGDFDMLKKEPVGSIAWYLALVSCYAKKALDRNITPQTKKYGEVFFEFYRKFRRNEQCVWAHPVTLPDSLVAHGLIDVGIRFEKKEKRQRPKNLCLSMGGIKSNTDALTVMPGRGMKCWE